MPLGMLGIVKTVITMGIVYSLNKKLINLFSYVGKNGKVHNIETYYGQKWSEIKTDNDVLNSIFEQVDDGNGVVDAKELNLLNKIFLYIDSLKKKNDVLSKKELKIFSEQLENGQIDLKEILKNDTLDGSINWSESLERKITTIKLATMQKDTELHQQLKKIAQEQGFTVEIVDILLDWIEDYSIRRHDGKIYISNHSDPTGKKLCPYRIFRSEKGNVNAKSSGLFLADGYGFDLKIDSGKKYYGTSYLEGGNVLNTIKADGTPGAIVGQSSIGMTIELLELDPLDDDSGELTPTSESIELAKKYIADDLGLKVSDVTFLPQFGFHIDMYYRPLQNGKIAVPDYEEGIRLLKELYSEKVKQGANPKELEMLKEKISELINTSNQINNIRNEANDILINDGYELVQIPCFTNKGDYTTNFMNGVAGTSPKTGETFYITNSSEDIPELDNILREYFIKAGIDNVYFVSAKEFLLREGGIDCLTQEE